MIGYPVRDAAASEAYVRSKGFHNVLDEALSEVLHYQPADPIGMMIDCLARVTPSSPDAGTEASANLERTLAMASRMLQARKAAGLELNNAERSYLKTMAVEAGIFDSNTPGSLLQISPFLRKTHRSPRESHDPGSPLSPANHKVHGQLTITQTATNVITGKVATPPDENGNAKNGASVNVLIRMKQAAFAPQLYSRLVRSQRAAEMLLQTALELNQSAVLNSDRLVNELITGAARLMDADRCTFFLLDGQELVSKIAEGTREIRIPIGSGLAGHVARTGDKINIQDAWTDSRFNKSIDLDTGYRTRSLLCAPVKHEGNIVAVVQLLNKANGQHFTADDEEMFEAFSAFAGVCIRNAQLYAEALYEKRKNELFLQVLAKLSKHTDIRDLTSVGQTVVESVTELLEADRCTLFLNDKERGVLKSSVTSKGDDPIEIPFGEGIAGHVAATGETVNIRDAYADRRFNSAVDRQTGYTTRSILAMPILNADSEVVAVTQVINKLNKQAFTEEDENMLRYFAYFAGIAIANASLYDFVLTSGKKAMDVMNAANTAAASGIISGNNNFTSLMPTKIDLQHFIQVETGMDKKELNAVLTTEFNVHNYALHSQKSECVVPFVIHMFKDMGFMERWRVDEMVLRRFLLCVKRKYRPVPYHSITHAFDVTQTIYTYLTKFGAKDLLTELDHYVLLVSAFLHDIDHMGLNNSFHMKAETPLGVLSAASGAMSVLEVHHCALSIELMGIADCDIFGALTGEERRAAFKVLINNILATDMARHREFLDKFKQMSSEGYNKENVEHRQLLMQLLLKSADISNVSKPFEISRLWGIAMTEEFYMQGDAERSRKLSITPQFNRENKGELAQSQIGFIKGVVLGMLETLVAGPLSGMTPILAQLQANLQMWEKILSAHPPKKT